MLETFFFLKNKKDNLNRNYDYLDLKKISPKLRLLYIGNSVLSINKFVYHFCQNSSNLLQKSIGKKCIFVHQKTWIRTFNTCFSTTQYPLSILYLPNTKTNGYCVPKNWFQTRVLCTNINNRLICFKKITNTYLKAKNSLHTTRISSFKY